MTLSPAKKPDEDFGIDLNQQSSAPPSNDDFGINMDEYVSSEKAQEANGWDYARDIIMQPVLGALKSFTWPLDVLKIGMIGEGLTDIDELEAIYKREGKEFNRDKYIKTVMDQSEFIPTQQLLEDMITEKTGIELKPKTAPGKWLNKLFFLRQMTQGKGLKESFKAGVAGATTTQALKGAGANETASEITGDIVAGTLPEVKKQARQLSPEAQRLKAIGDKHGLPFLETMAKDNISSSAKISKARKAKLDEKLGMSSREAIDEIVEGKLPIAKLKKQGIDLEVLEDAAYDEATQLARSNTNPLNTNQIVQDIDTEIARIKSLAPSPSSGQQEAIRILEAERDALRISSPTTEQLINQRKNYNQEVKGIYKKGQTSPVDEEVKNAYGFLNGSIDRTIEAQSGKAVSDKYKIARDIYGQNKELARTEGLINKAFEGGYSAKKLNKLLNSKAGGKLRQDIGDQGIRELKDIAEFGEKAQQATMQYANSSKHGFNIQQWGPLAGLILSKIGAAKGILLAAKPMADYVRGYALTRPAARTVYRNILKNASEGSFKTMAADFAQLESMIIDDYGSLEEFFKTGVQELQLFNPEED